MEGIRMILHRTLSTLVALAALVALPATASAAAPGATTGDASNIASTSATVSGTVNPNKEGTTYHFEYGTTTAYGTSTPDQGPVGGNAGKSASADLTQLAPATAYHYRLVATNPSGTTQGSDKTFTTLASGQAPPGGNAVTLAANPASVAFGGATTLAGQVTGQRNAGVEVTLQSHPTSATPAAFTDVATATTDANGNYTFAQTPLVNTQYQVEAKASPKVTSPIVAVSVRFVVSRRVSDSTPKRGTRVRFSGVVKPAHDGAFALIQRRASTGKFRTVTKALLKASKTAGQSRYGKRLRITRSGVYRVRVPADASHARGTSRKVKIRVH
jgi:hypothetical protein